MLTDEIHRATTTALRCRPITAADLDAVIALLMRGFADRSEAYWRRGLARHVARKPPDGYPLYGFMLDAGGEAVGVLLTLHSAIERDGGTTIRCNLSSWYVEPRYRAQAVLLDKLAGRHKEVTYLNVTPAPHTWTFQEARGFVRYCHGQMLAFPALARVPKGMRTRVVTPDDPLDDLPPNERTLVRDHLGYGCFCLVGSDRGGSQPFVFLQRTIGLSQSRVGRGKVPIMQLVFCRTPGDLPRFAGSIGRTLLLRRGMPWVVLDADRPIQGLFGRFFPGRGPKYTRGPDPVGLNDLSYTELVLFGP